ncbi:MAG: C-GCAxxG-C-C family protein [Chordicoccus sp.]
MSIYMDRAKTVRAITERHYNCAQSVLVSFYDVIGLDEEQAYRLGSHFGAGMKMGATCGAITGAMMVLGLAGIDDADTLREIYRNFRERHNDMLNCRDLLAASAKAGVPRKTHCDGLVFEMVDATEKILREKGVLPAADSENEKLCNR